MGCTQARPAASAEEVVEETADVRKQGLGAVEEVVEGVWTLKATKEYRAEWTETHDDEGEIHNKVTVVARTTLEVEFERGSRKPGSWAVMQWTGTWLREDFDSISAAPGDEFYSYTVAAAGEIAAIGPRSGQVAVALRRFCHQGYSEQGCDENRWCDSFPWSLPTSELLSEKMTKSWDSLRVPKEAEGGQARPEPVPAFPVEADGSLLLDVATMDRTDTKINLEPEADHLLREFDSIRAGFELSFEFLSAERLRATEGPLPKYQDLRREGGWLHTRAISMAGVLEGSFKKSMVVVSHRWVRHNNPWDDEGRKLRALREFLHQHPEVEFVWLDYTCIPQEEWNDQRTYKVLERTPEDKELFDSKLPHINTLYLGLTVLLLVDDEYLNRFWTSFEAYLSMQAITMDGFSNDSTRAIPVFLQKSDAMEKGIDAWGKRSYEEAVHYLQADNIAVTNQSDKQICLKKLAQLKRNMAVMFNTLQPPAPTYGQNAATQNCYLEGC